MRSAAKNLLRAAASRILHWVPTVLWRRLFPKTVIGVCYHVVSDVTVPHVRHYPVLSIADFEADLTYLRRRFDSISYEQLVERRNSPGSVRCNSVIVTFDDGFAECVTVVAPILRRHGTDCVFFVITDLIDNTVAFCESEAALCIEALLQLPVEHVEAVVIELGLDSRLRPPPGTPLFDLARQPLDIAGLGYSDRRLRPVLHWLLTIDATEVGLMRQLSARLGIDTLRYLRQVRPYLTTDQIRQLQAAGFTIGAHSRSHRRLQGLTSDEAELEIVESCRIVRDKTGQNSVPFAFPYCGHGLDRAWLAQLRQQHDFIGLFFDTNGLCEDEPFVVNRVFGERFGHDRTLDGIIRSAWARWQAW